jgi:hypothetical protein
MAFLRYDRLSRFGSGSRVAYLPKRDAKKNADLIRQAIEQEQARLAADAAQHRARTESYLADLADGPKLRKKPATRREP